MEFAPMVLTPIFSRLLDLLAPLLSQEVGFLFCGVEGEEKKLEEVLLGIQLLLSDAEDRQIQDKLVGLWLSKLKDAAYEAEDVLDELAYKALRFKQEAQVRTRVPYFFSSCCYYGSNRNMGHRIKKSRERLEEIKSESNHLNLKVVYESERLKPSRERPPTTSIVDESTVIGREADRDKVVGLLLTSDEDDSSPSSSSSAGRNGIRVVPICGMGGLGKTTLAQLVYNDQRVKKHFDVRAWIYVSQDFDLIRLTKEIAESVTGVPPNLTNFDNIQCSIKEALDDKRFLVVLDDVWNDNCNDWDALRAPFINGVGGSRILVTTRSQTVSSIVGTVPTHSLRGLSHDDCWSLFEQRAFVEGNSDAHPHLKKIGKDIVNKCNGLPLAVKSLGGLLRSKVEVVEWEAILKSEIWGLPEDKNDILPALRLSYHHLPAPLKRCFAYCSMFRKRVGIEGNELVLKWMAQGYIQSEGSKQAEDIGREYLAYLVSWSLLDTCPNYTVPPYIVYLNDDGECVQTYTMHDLSYDLARSVLGAEFLDAGDMKSHTNVEKACHISYCLSPVKSFNFEDLYFCKRLRTHMFFESTYPKLTYNILADFFVNLRYLRLLDLTDASVMELPESIGNLIHLRLLDLSWMKIKRLPKSTTRLYHLQTLILNHCFKLVELPRDFSNLVNLRHLSLWQCRVSMPPGIGRLKSLQGLGEFNVGKEIGWRINELKDMIHLRGLLHISKLENVVSVQEAKKAELGKKQKIHSLKLKWKSDDVELRQKGIEDEVLKGLQPHTNLKVLEISGYCGGTFPRWLGDSSFSNLVIVYLVKCRCHLLPSFGQLPSLRKLYLFDLHEVKKVGREFYGDGTVKCFPSLQELFVHFMPDLEEWNGLEGDISHVSEITTINKCSKLRGLALFPLTLERVRIENCERLATLPRVSIIRHLTLSGCDERILSSLQYLTALSSLMISKFSNLTSLPNGSLQPLTALERLEICECYQLMSLLDEVGLQHLTSLKYLAIHACPQLTSLGDEVLPTTLQSLEISTCDNLNCLPTGLQNLTSLVKLELLYCPKIHSLPEKLPTTLQLLSILFCPLEEKCRDGGEYWSKISYIPKIIVDNMFIKGFD